MPRALVVGSVLLGAHACIMTIPDPPPDDSCEPGTLVGCYTGPPETRRVGTCQEGTAECLEGGELGECERDVGPALEQCTTDVVLDEDCNGQDNEHCAEWAAVYGNEGAQGIESMAITGDDDVVVLARNSAGGGGARIDFGGGNLDVGVYKNTYAVARLGPSGEHDWSALFDAEPAVSTPRLVFDETLGVLVVGSFTVQLIYAGVVELTTLGEAESVFVARLNGANGERIAFAAFGDEDVQLGRAVAAGGGSVIIGGSAAGTVDFSPAGIRTAAGGADAFVAKLDADLVPIWALFAGAEGDDHVSRVVMDDVGDVYVAGSFAQALDFGSPCAPLAAEGESDAFVAKLGGSDGGCRWVRHIGGSGAESVAALTWRDALYLSASFTESVSVGTFQGQSLGNDDFLIAVLDENGESVAHRAFGAAGNQIARDLAILPSGSIAVVGTIGGSIDFGGGLMEVTYQATETQDDAFVLFLDTGLEHLFSRQFSDRRDDDAFAVVATSSGQLMVAGEFDGSIDFGTGALTTYSDEDAYLMRLPP
jgi:hypothetical protein